MGLLQLEGNGLHLHIVAGIGMYGDEKDQFEARR